MKFLTRIHVKCSSDIPCKSTLSSYRTQMEEINERTDITEEERQSLLYENFKVNHISWINRVITSPETQYDYDGILEESEDYILFPYNHFVNNGKNLYFLVLDEISKNSLELGNCDFFFKNGSQELKTVPYVSSVWTNYFDNWTYNTSLDNFFIKNSTLVHVVLQDESINTVNVEVITLSDNSSIHSSAISRTVSGDNAVILIGKNFTFNGVQISNRPIIEHSNVEEFNLSTTDHVTAIYISKTT